MPTTTLETLRQKVIKKLYAGHYPIVSNTTSDSDSRTVIKDVELAPAALKEDFFRCYVFISSQPTKVDSGANINEGGTFSATDVTLTVTDGTKFTAGDGIQIDNEILRVSSITGNDLTVVRGIQSTTATTHTDATDIYIIGPAIGEIARVTNTSFSGSNSQFTIAPSLSCSPVSNTEYEIHYHFYPNQIRDKINEILGNIRGTIFLPLTLITDGDMESSGVTNWTAAGTGGTPTLAKNTSTVMFGRRSLSITNNASTTLGYAKSASVNVPPSTEVLVGALVYITAGDSAKITLYDVTNSAAIETAESAATGWILLLFTATTPATCEQVALWLESPAASDVTYWNFTVLLRTQLAIYDYPGSLDWSEDFDEVFYFPKGDALSATTDDLAYRVLEETTEKWSSTKILRDETAVIPFRIQLAKKPINEVLFIQGNVDYVELTSDSDTTRAPDDIIVDLTYADMMDSWAQEELNEDKIESAQAKSAKAAAVRTQLGPRMLHFHKARGKVAGTKRSI